MIDSTVFGGLPRLRILNSDGSTLKTLYLAAPDREGGVTISDVWARAIEWKTLSGAKRFYPGGVRHNLTLSWAYYDPVYASRQTGRSIGVADGQIPELAHLYELISTYNQDRLAISPGWGASDPFYRVYCTSEMSRTPELGIVYRDVRLDFEGRDVYASTLSTTPIG